MRDINKEVLKSFYEDGPTREEVQKYLAAHLDALALEKVYAKADILGIADARIAIEAAFKQLEDMFEKKTPRKKEQINEAR